MEMYYQGWVKNKTDLQEQRVVIKQVGIYAAEQLIELQALVVAELEDQASYYPLTEEEVALALTPQHGLVLGAFVEEQLIGFRIMIFPRANKDNLGLDIGLSPNALDQVVHLEAVCIHPDYRGNALQKVMTRLVLEQLTRTGQGRHICLTVAPDNLASIKNTLANHLYITQLSYKYKHILRYIFYQDLGEPLKLDRDHHLAIPYTQVAEQHKALAAGYYGYELVHRESGLFLLLAKKKV